MRLELPEITALAITLNALSCGPSLPEPLSSTLEEGICLTNAEVRAAIPYAVTDENIEEFINQPGVAFLEFSHFACEPCHEIPGLMQELAQKYPGKFRFGEYSTNLCENSKAEEYKEKYRDKYGKKYKGVPDIFVFRDGKKIGRISGKPANIFSRLESYLKD